MSIITFWNNSKSGHIGQTSSLVAVATLMAVEHNYKILLISTEDGAMELDKAYGVSENSAMKFLGLKEVRFNSGIEGVMKLANSGKLTPQLIGNFTKIVLKNRLEVIAGKKETNEEENEKFDANGYPDVIKIANKYYDMVFVDLNRGLESNITRKILEASNLIICNMEQKIEEVENLVELQRKEKIVKQRKGNKTKLPKTKIENENLVNGKNIMYLLNRYEKNSKYNAKNIIRSSRMKKDLYTVPYDLMYSDALQDGVVDQWILNPKIRKATIEEEHGFFISQVNKFCEGIIYKLQELHVLG